MLNAEDCRGFIRCRAMHHRNRDWRRRIEGLLSARHQGNVKVVSVAAVLFLLLAVGFPASWAEKVPVTAGSVVPRQPSGQVYLDTDTQRQPFQLREIYKHGVSSPQPKRQPSAHGIVGLDLLISSNRYPVVTGVFDGTPAERLGIQPGDTIVAVNGVQAIGKSRAQVDAMISDKPGESVDFLVARGAALKRIRLQVESIDALSDYAKAGFLHPEP
jgi:membrane-associated protease RseP (regulator of RpoE activity)